MSKKPWKGRLPGFLVVKRYGYQEFRGWVVVVFASLCGVAIIAALIGAAAFFDRRSCEQTSVHMGVESRWDFHAGCFIEVNGSMVPEGRVTWNEHGEIVIRDGEGS